MNPLLKSDLKFVKHHLDVPQHHNVLCKQHSFGEKGTPMPGTEPNWSMVEVALWFGTMLENQ